MTRKTRLGDERPATWNPLVTLASNLAHYRYKRPERGGFSAILELLLIPGDRKYGKTIGAAMKITYRGDSGARYDWACEHGEEKYLVSYHHEDDCWTVQINRNDGEREILSESEAMRILDAFPKQRAADLTSGPSRTGDDKICEKRASPPDHESHNRDARPAPRSGRQAGNGREAPV